MSRTAFHEEAFARSEQFAKDLLAAVPEVEAVVVVPVFGDLQTALPAGLLLGRQGPVQRPVEIMHTAWQLHAMLRLVVERSFQVLAAVDAEMARLAKEIQTTANHRET